ncbi:hypothetical protein DL93DRAFT_1124729 [Clavulina sp. PMI_390]|nr:hypothetical protein DL93DRAFT_1124729 [Clavulina sp. PMI_390]
MLVPGGRWVVALQQHGPSWLLRCWAIHHNASSSEQHNSLSENKYVTSKAIAQDLDISFPDSQSPPTIVICDYHEIDDTFNFVVYTQDPEAESGSRWRFTIVHLRSHLRGGEHVPSLTLGPSLDGSQLVPDERIDLEEWWPSPADAGSLARDVFMFGPEDDIVYFWDWKHNNLGYEDRTGLRGWFLSRSGHLVNVTQDVLFSGPNNPVRSLFVSPNCIPRDASSLTPDGQHQPVYLES